MSKPWYNEDRVKQPGSVILNAFVAGRQAERAAKNKNSSRSYAGAQVNRLTSDWSALNTSADSEIVTSIRLLRARSRQLVRDNEYAKQAVRVVQNNVIGQGIGMQAQVVTARGKLMDTLNDQIEAEFEKWCDRSTCHTAGLLHFHDIERLIAGQLVEAGEVLIRKVRQPFGGGTIPFALEVIEADRLMDQWQTARAPNGNAIRMGVEVDSWGRPVAYWLYPTHPGDYQFTSFQPSKFVRLPAEEVIHLYLIDRWPQTRGVPWFHATLKRLNDMGGYEEAEIVAARASANIVGFITSPDSAVAGDVQNGQRIEDTAPGQIKSLLPGEEFQGFNPSRPNAALEPFMRFMLRGVAAGVGVSYESLSRDYSNSNYSSSRLALLDDRDMWRVLQGWIIRNFRMQIHKDWLSAAVMAGRVQVPDYYSNRDKYEAVRFKPRGWGWIDPAKEVAAYRASVRSGFMTVSDVIAQTAGGADMEDVFNTRRRELDMMEELGLVFDTDPAQVNDKGQLQPADSAVADPESSGESTTDGADTSTDELSDSTDN